MPEQLQFEYDVFLSYSSHDKEWVRGELLPRIEAAGLRAFIDFRDFRPGAASIKEMERGVTACRTTLLVLSPEYIASAWCEIENIMLQTIDPANRGLRLIPLLKADCKKPLRIAAFTHIDFTRDADIDLAWRRLFAALSASPEPPSENTIPTEIQAELDSIKTLTDADRYSEALPLLEKALAGADASGHATARVKVRLNLAWALYEDREDYAAAERHLRDALILVPVENLDLKHAVLHALGEMLEFSGRLDEARAIVDLTLEVAKRSGKADDIAVSLMSMGLLERALGLHDTAGARIDEAMRLLLQDSLSVPASKKLDHTHLLAVSYMNKALLCRDAGNLEEAMALYRKVLDQDGVTKLDKGRAHLLCGEVHCTNAEWQKGIECFAKAMECFQDIGNSLWSARAFEDISRLQATHGHWDKAWETMWGAVLEAERAGHPKEQVRYLCAAAELGREWKTRAAREDVSRQMHARAKRASVQEQSAMISDLSAKLDDVSGALEKAIREDKEVRELLDLAKQIAREQGLNESLANCLLHEAYHMIAPEDISAKSDLIIQAVELLKEELQKSQFPKRRGHLMGRISALSAQLGEPHQSLSWLKKAGAVFEKAGDAFGLANYHATRAEIHRADGQFDDEIASYRNVLSIIEGRSFHHLAAGTRINLAAALRQRGEFDEALRLLSEAEELCEKHRFKEFVGAIGRNRSNIENELESARAPAHTLQELLESLRELVEYRPEYAVDYLAFWYFAWKTELLALLRSGPRLSLMVASDDVERFMQFAGEFRQLADHFLMVGSEMPEIEAKAVAFPIPPSWKFPLTFPFMFVKRPAGPEGQVKKAADDDALPSFHVEGPARNLPPYMLTEGKSGVAGEGHMMAMAAARLPKEAVELMLQRPMQELIERRAIFLPTDRFKKDENRFLIDLRIAHERGLFPVYFGSPPYSDAAAVCGGVEIVVPNKVLSGDQPGTASKWRRALLKLTKVSKDEAQRALLDLPEVFGGTDDGEAATARIEIRLFEFSDLGRQHFYPVILVSQ
jgi:tetratricopeptide (TPR) repeat protein